jgi:uncharacterized protein YutE (UPF0331/DUF86 family)
MKNYIRTQIEETQKVMTSMLADAALLVRVEAAAHACIEAMNNGNKVLLAGNGGSAADEAVTKVMDGYAEFSLSQTQVPWRSMRGMRNRIAHGYFDINLEVVLETVQSALPALLEQLPPVRQAAQEIGV